MAKYALVQAGFGAPERQSRWKIGFRFILAIPIDLWLFVLSIWGVFLIIIGWFCALVLGRLPFAIAQYLSNLIVRQTRANSYIYLMNDAYPPFSAKADFGVNVMIPITKVRRFAVLFRYILLIPAGLVQGLVTSGLSICSIFIWLIVLVKGEMPLSLFGAIAAVLRFQARTSAYAMMLTGKYPGELFGEKAQETEGPFDAPDVAASPELSTPQVPETVAPTSAVAAETSDDALTSEIPGGVAEVGPSLTPGAPTGTPTTFYSSESTTDSERPRTARLVLSRASKRILVIFIIIGVLGYAAYGVIDVTFLHNVGSLTALENANNVVVGELNAAKAQSASCTLGPNTCLQQYYHSAANDFYGFERAVSVISFPASAQTDATRLLNDTAAFYMQLNLMSVASNTITPAQTNQLQTLGTKFDADYAQLISDLSPSI